MVECFIKLGLINQKLIIPCILLLISILHILYINYILEYKANIIVTEISASFGHMAIIIIPYIKCFSSKKRKIKYLKQKNNYLLNYSIFLLTYLLHLIFLELCSYYKPNSENKNKSILYETTGVNGIYCLRSFENLFIIIFSLLLKYKYFIHQYICLSIFIISSISIDYILGNFSYELNSTFFKYIGICIAQLINESINLSYQKYMFDKLYYSPYSVCFAFGVLFFCYQIVKIIIFLLIDYLEFWNYFDNANLGYEAFKFILNIFIVFLLYTSMALTNYYFTPNHIIVNYELGNMIIFLWKSDNIKYYTIILFIFQFFILMIFLEIIELNFCHLNDNTKRNIQIRGYKDMEDKDKRDTVIEISGYFLEEDILFVIN